MIPNQSDPIQMQIALQEIIEGLLENLGKGQKVSTTDAGTLIRYIFKDELLINCIIL